MPWWPDELWRCMLDGSDCPMCANGHEATNDHGALIATLPGSYARLCINQTRPGYVVAIARRHAAELHDLTADELSAFWRDVAALGRTVAALFQPVKLDYLVMGHLCPHVHCHLYPQYNDSDPNALIDVRSGDVRLESGEWADRIASIRSHLASHYPSARHAP